MYSSSDFERLFVKYNCEAKPSGISIQRFCNSNKVPYNLFEKWYKDTRHKVVAIQIDNAPSDDSSTKALSDVPAQQAETESRILVDIHVSNGLHIRQGNLNYRSLQRLVENLEALC